MFVLMVLLLLAGCLIVVTLMLVGLALRVVIGLALLPFKIAGLAIRLAVGLGIGLIGLILASAMLLIPLLPIVALVGGIWLILRLSRRPVAAPASRLAS